MGTSCIDQQSQNEEDAISDSRSDDQRLLEQRPSTSFYTTGLPFRDQKQSIQMFVCDREIGNYDGEVSQEVLETGFLEEEVHRLVSDVILKSSLHFSISDSSKESSLSSAVKSLLCSTLEEPGASAVDDSVRDVEEELVELVVQVHHFDSNLSEGGGEDGEEDREYEKNAFNGNGSDSSQAPSPVIDDVVVVDIVVEEEDAPTMMTVDDEGNNNYNEEEEREEDEEGCLIKVEYLSLSSVNELLRCNDDQSQPDSSLSNLLSASSSPLPSMTTNDNDNDEVQQEIHVEQLLGELSHPDVAAPDAIPEAVLPSSRISSLPLIKTNTLLPLEQPEVSEESETLDFGKCGTANVETGFSRSSKLASRPKRSLESTTSLQSSPSTEETTTTDNNTDGGDSDEDDANNNNRRNESNENIKNVPKKTEQQKGRSTQQDSNAHVAEDANCYSTGTILHFPKSIAWDWPFCSEGVAHGCYSEKKFQICLPFNYGGGGTKVPKRFEIDKVSESSYCCKLGLSSSSDDSLTGTARCNQFWGMEIEVMRDLNMLVLTVFRDISSRKSTKRLKRVRKVYQLADQFDVSTLTCSSYDYAIVIEAGRRQKPPGRRKHAMADQLSTPRSSRYISHYHKK